MHICDAIFETKVAQFWSIYNLFENMKTFQKHFLVI